MDHDLTDTFGPLIHTYTRADMLADGSLIDITDTAREAGFTIPTAITRAAWIDTVEWDDAHGQGQSERGRLWDVVSMAYMAARAAIRKGATEYTVYRILNHEGASTPTPTRLALRLSRAGKQTVLTITNPDEN